MRRSKIVIPVHLVWATHERLPLIRPECQEELYSQIWLELIKLQVDTIAIGGVSNHVHVAIRLPATRTVAEIMKQVKGASSHFLGEKCNDIDGFFKENQETHHAQNDIWPALEATDEDALVREDADEVGYVARDFNPSELTEAIV